MAVVKCYDALKEIPIKWEHPDSPLRKGRKPRIGKDVLRGSPRPIPPFPTHVKLDGDEVEVKVYPGRPPRNGQLFVCPCCGGERTRLWRFEE